MKIPKEILEKYHISMNHLDDEMGMYRTFLTVTDFEIIKGYDKLLSEPLKFLSNLATLAKNLKEVCEHRQIAREELEKLEKQA